MTDSATVVPPDLRLVQGGHDQRDPDGVASFHSLVVAAFHEIATAACDDDVGLDDLLRLVGRRLCELLGVSRSSVYLRREDGRFQGKVGYSAGTASIDARVSRQVTGVDAFTSEIVNSTAPVVIHDARNNTRTFRRAMRQWRVQDILGVPLVVDNEVIGIIYVDDQARNHDFTEHDVRLAEAFAGLSAFAVKQTWQRERLARQAKNADRECRMLGFAAEVRARITRAMTDGADIDDVLQLAAELLHKPIVLYNSRFEATAWKTPEQSAGFSAPVLTREQSTHPHFALLIAKLDSKGGSVVIRATPDLRCRRQLSRLSVDDETLGYLELYELGSAFRAADARVLEELSAVLALKLRLDQRFGTRETVGRMDFFVDLLFGRREPSVLETRASSFDVDPGREHLVLVIPHAELAPATEAAQQSHEAVADDIARRLDGALRLVDHVPTSRHHLALLEIDMPAEGRARLRPLIEEASQALSGARPGGVMVFTDCCSTLGELPDAVRQGLEVADLLHAHQVPDVGVAFAQDLELLRLVSRGGSLDDALHYSEHLLRPLVEHDRSSGGQLTETLHAFIDCGAQFRGAAARLGVHENTVRYRLHRIGEISSIDPTNFTDLTRAQFALQVARLVPGRSPAARSLN